MRSKQTKNRLSTDASACGDQGSNYEPAHLVQELNVEHRLLGKLLSYAKYVVVVVTVLLVRYELAVVRLERDE